MYASFLKITPDGLKRVARLASGAFYRAVHLMTGMLPGHAVLPQGRTPAYKGGEASLYAKSLNLAIIVFWR
jgi:hypothetical protein